MLYCFSLSLEKETNLVCVDALSSEIVIHLSFWKVQLLCDIVNICVTFTVFRTGQA